MEDVEAQSHKLDIVEREAAEFLQVWSFFDSFSFYVRVIVEIISLLLLPEQRIVLEALKHSVTSMSICILLWQ